MRGDLLDKLGRLDEARAEFERAASLTRNERERKLLLDRAAACARGPRQDGKRRNERSPEIGTGSSFRCLLRAMNSPERA